MYRSVAALALQEGIAPDDHDAVAALAAAAVIEVGTRVVINGHDVTDVIRSPQIGQAVSDVAANADVRTQLVQRQRAWAEAHGGGVVEGRDIGSVVFPDAELKVYLTAADGERAARRSKEMLDLHYDQVAADIARRDHYDSTRVSSPLSAADDAVTVDTTGLGIEAVVDKVAALLARAERD
jgi:cytidylate kinase